jgi:RNA polymerase sigma-70 factor (ECF subfamily)
VELLRAGSRDVFAEVYDRHVREVLALARARIGEHAADLTAEVFAASGRRRLGLPRLVAGDTGLDAVHERLSLSEVERRALASLPQEDRELLRLRVIEERPYRELAAQLECTPQAARLRVSRLLRQLQYSLGGQHP